MNYLIYIERSAENLQFFLWYRDYSQRFKDAQTSDIALAPEWTQAMADETAAKIQKEHMEKMKREPEAAQIFHGTDFEKAPLHPTAGVDSKDPFGTPPTTPGDQESAYGGSQALSYRSQAGDAFTAAGVKQPCKS
jgi:hypothetical protein